MNFQEKLTLLRKKFKMSQENLAEKVGLSRQAVAKWETGNSLPDINNLIALSRLFGISIDSMVKSEEGDCAILFGKEDILESDKMLDFLLRAKKATYAGYGPEGSASRPSSHDIVYEEGEYFYYDTYLGGEKFAGEEGVWISQNPVWAMNYSGRVLSQEFSGDFLKRALSHPSKELPYRGPLLFTEEEYTYHSTSLGDLNWFQGAEEIFYQGSKVYECVFHGGAIR
ncbi:DUF5680 domain-containing protein [Anaerocolumna sp. AGMB13020]|uniref:DUF5680 domain-containing protein n=1 Tax=Anaerocolumna sp. AGMB13020 TaxID=3081750 RepID=UPI0029538CB9|nr:DUF5680 domain-containing protein [Anaerocolumna sp. AGMB13020]WOO36794.1 DUF5680 domain-containing protein [Anaerocolumna sp. AGMB13020]